MNYLKRIKIVENILFESLKTARALYSGIIPEKDFNILISFDPSKTFKYVERICSYYTQGIQFPEIKSAIERFDELSVKNIIQQKDINTFKNFKELKKFLESYSSIITKSEERNITKINGTQVILNTYKILVLLIKDEAAAIKYGKGTKWCISAKFYLNSFNDYSVDGTTFYFIFQKELPSDNPAYKIAVGVFKNGKMVLTNAINKKIRIDVLSKIGLQASLFKPIKLTAKEKLPQFIHGNFKVNSDGSIDVKGDVNIRGINIKSISEVAIFRNVSGDFFCWGNTLTNLEGCPKRVGGNFSVSQNKLKSFLGCPEFVGGNFKISNNKITSLSGFTCKVMGDLLCNSNNFSQPEEIPDSVMGELVW